MNVKLPGAGKLLKTSPLPSNCEMLKLLYGEQLAAPEADVQTTDAHSNPAEGVSLSTAPLAACGPLLVTMML